jgi:hypothetical protein
MLAGLLFRVRLSKRTLVGQRRVRICDSQNASAQRNLFEAQTVRISAAVPPFMMPADQQLRAAIRTRRGRFALADDRMASQIDSLVVAKRALPVKVIAVHHDFAKVVGEGGDAKREPVARTKPKLSGNLVGDCGNS